MYKKKDDYFIYVTFLEKLKLKKVQKQLISKTEPRGDVRCKRRF